mmetsp:Transcript_23729/g.39189  ORF Transcript_23729/g.39189 Transcript_23729/m.39189 type:complete len:301 (+) Transcript_23729:27-929(+)
MDFFKRLFVSCGGGAMLFENGIDEAKETVQRPLAVADANVLERLGVVPDLLASFAGGIATLTVTYGGRAVKTGDELAPAATKMEPTIEITPAEEDAFYTLVMTDPDAPCRENPLYREFVHWVVCDIPGAKFDKGLTVAPYVCASPPHKSGKHRYVFLLFKQERKALNDYYESRVPMRMEISVLKAARKHFKPRGGLSAIDWAAEIGLGEPIAVECYEAKWDESCDEAHEALAFVPPDEYKSPKQAAAAAAATEAQEHGHDEKKEHDHVDGHDAYDCCEHGLDEKKEEHSHSHGNDETSTI